MRRAGRAGCFPCLHLVGHSHAGLVRITGVTIDYPDPSRPYVNNGEPVAIRVRFEARQPVDDVVVAIALHGTDGHVVFGQNTWGLGERIRLEGDGELTFDLQCGFSDC